MNINKALYQIQVLSNKKFLHLLHMVTLCAFNHCCWKLSDVPETNTKFAFTFQFLLQRLQILSIFSPCARIFVLMGGKSLLKSIYDLLIWDMHALSTISSGKRVAWHDNVIFKFCWNGTENGAFRASTPPSYQIQVRIDVITGECQR